MSKDYLTSSLVRNLDPVGRITIPHEILYEFNLWKADLIISVDGEKIILEKYVSLYQCFFCDNADRVVRYKGYRICKNCLQVLMRLYQKNFDLQTN